MFVICCNSARLTNWPRWPNIMMLSGAWLCCTKKLRSWSSTLHSKSTTKKPSTLPANWMHQQHCDWFDGWPGWFDGWPGWSGWFDGWSSWSGWFDGWSSWSAWFDGWSSWSGWFDGWSGWSGWFGWFDGWPGWSGWSDSFVWWPNSWSATRPNNMPNKIDSPSIMHATKVWS